MTVEFYTEINEVKRHGVVSGYNITVPIESGKFLIAQSKKVKAKLEVVKAEAAK